MPRLCSMVALFVLLGQGAAFLAQDLARGKTLSIDFADPINSLNGIFLGIGNAFQFDCRDQLDANHDGTVDISDPVYTLSYLFGGDESPPAPGPQAGQDPTADLSICFE